MTVSPTVYIVGEMSVTVDLAGIELIRAMRPIADPPAPVDWSQQDRLIFSIRDKATATRVHLTYTTVSPPLLHSVTIDGRAGYEPTPADVDEALRRIPLYMYAVEASLDRKEEDLREVATRLSGSSYRRITTTALQTWAKEYLELVEAGQYAPLRVLAARRGRKSVRTEERWKRAARQAGLLPTQDEGE